MSDMTNLATKLADLKLFQNTLIKLEQHLMVATNDEKIRERLEKILNQDRENVAGIEQAISKFGESVESRDITQKHAQKVESMMDGNELTEYDKFFQL